MFIRINSVTHISTLFRHKLYDEISPYLSKLHFHDYDVPIDLMFDPSQFKADRQLRISEETKQVLAKSPGQRTETELHKVQRKYSIILSLFKVISKTHCCCIARNHFVGFLFLLFLIKSAFLNLILYIFQAQVALRNLKSFAEYPMRMQTKIVQVGKYER